MSSSHSGGVLIPNEISEVITNSFIDKFKSWFGLDAVKSDAPTSLTNAVKSQLKEIKKSLTGENIPEVSDMMDWFNTLYNTAGGNALSKIDGKFISSIPVLSKADPKIIGNLLKANPGANTLKTITDMVGAKFYKLPAEEINNFLKLIPEGKLDVVKQIIDNGYFNTPGSLENFGKTLAKRMQVADMLKGTSEYALKEILGKKESVIDNILKITEEHPDIASTLKENLSRIVQDNILENPENLLKVLDVIKNNPEFQGKTNYVYVIGDSVTMYGSNDTAIVYDTISKTVKTRTVTKDANGNIMMEYSNGKTEPLVTKERIDANTEKITVNGDSGIDNFTGVKDPNRGCYNKETIIHTDPNTGLKTTTTNAEISNLSDGSKLNIST